MFLLSIALLLMSQVRGHGRITVPTSRQAQEGAAIHEQNAPVSGFNGEDFVCRGSPKAPQVTLTAGGSLELQWSFSAKHTGDCAVYISYDHDAAKKDMKFFKIANLFKCRQPTTTFTCDETTCPDVIARSIKLPNWLPGGRAVLRWDWYALHNAPGIVEFYGQCVDVDITPTESASTEGLVAYPIIGQDAIYPKDGNTGVGYRDPRENANSEQYMTGPPCAKDFGENDCHRTAKGTTGSVDVGSGAGSGSGAGGSEPTPNPTSSPTEPTPNPTPSPTEPTPNPTSSPTEPTPNPTSSPTETPNPTPSPTEPTPNPTTSGQQNLTSCEIYTVVTGDALGTIAAAYTNQDKPVTWEEICEANSMTNCDMLKIGAKLKIPCATCGPCTGDAKDPDSARSGATLILVLVILGVVGGVMALAWCGCMGMTAYKMTRRGLCCDSEQTYADKMLAETHKPHRPSPPEGKPPTPPPPVVGELTHSPFLSIKSSVSNKGSLVLPTTTENSSNLFTVPTTTAVTGSIKVSNGPRETV